MRILSQSIHPGRAPLSRRRSVQLATEGRPDPQHRRSGHHLSAWVLAVAAVLVAGCGPDIDGGSASGGGAAPAATSQIRVDDDFFEPDAVEVATGTEVTWTWVGSNAHNVTADGFSSETQTDGAFSHTFDQAGSYAYVCTLHPGMDGAVIVTDTAGGDAT